MTEEEFEKEQRLDNFLETVQDTLWKLQFSDEITPEEWNDAFVWIRKDEATTPEEFLGNPLIDKIYHQLYDEK